MFQPGLKVVENLHLLTVNVLCLTDLVCVCLVN